MASRSKSWWIPSLCPSRAFCRRLSRRSSSSSSSSTTIDTFAKLTGRCSSPDSLTTYTKAVVDLIEHVHLVLRNGLKDRTMQLDKQLDALLSGRGRPAAPPPPPSYWAFVASKTFSKNIEYIDQLAAINPLLDKERAWIALALSEGTLASHFAEFQKDRRAVGEHYTSAALLTDQQRLPIVHDLLDQLSGTS